MFIKNFKKLAKTPLRKNALEIIESGFWAIYPPNVFKKEISLKGDILTIKNEKINLEKFKNIYFIGIGKAAAFSAKYFSQILGNRITEGAIIDIQKIKLSKIKSFVGDHPFPSKRNIEATKKIIEIAKKAQKNDLIITIVSGGGSALFFYPYQLSVLNYQKLTKKLFDVGANIKEINTIRKHISYVKGGNLAKLAYPATMVSLIFSDVPFSDFSLVASGPTVLDKTTKKDAQNIIKKYNLPKIKLRETPKDKKYFKKVKNILILDNNVALKAMQEKSQELGFKSFIYSSKIKGESKLVAKKLLEILSKQPKNTILLAGGETTVKIKGKGKGGRNQELVLSALKYLKEEQLIISIASDGKDNIKGVAGAIGDSLTIKNAQKLNLDIDFYLENNDSYRFFKKTGDLIFTKNTGSNVSDLIILIKE